MTCRSHAEYVPVPPTYLMILDTQTRISTQRSYISSLAADHSARNTSLGQLCILDGPPSLYPVWLQAQGFLGALHSLEKVPKGLKHQIYPLYCP